VSPTGAPTGWRAPIAFAATALATTWATVALLASTELPPVSRLLGATILYVAMLGWQPLLALAVAQRVSGDGVDRLGLDRGARPATTRFLGIGIAAPLALIAVAAVLDATVLSTVREREPVDANGVQAVRLAIAFAAVLVLLWLQALVEEVAWRGYLLPHLMRAFGPWVGLAVHGLVWGACYAPIFLFTGGGPALAAGAIVTCGLAGFLLGWLRLASGSIVASGASNATLTLCAGLPLVLFGASPPASAIVEPLGWALMLLAIAALSTRSQLRRAVAIPLDPLPDHVN
jgi:membrane protease YdiL (CAAX protease family)